MALINPYLNFDGNTEEAFNFYKSVFGGGFSILQRYGDISSQQGFGNVSESDKDKIVHIALPIREENVLMGTDVLESMGNQLTIGNNFSISVHTESKEEAEKIFNGLSEGGQITMPLADTFWGSYFGTCNDKFGIPWKVSYDKQ